MYRRILILAVVIIAVSCSNCVAEELPDIYKEVFIDNIPGETVTIEEYASIRIDQVQWMTYEEYVREYRKEDQHEYQGHCTVITMEIENLSSREIVGLDLINDMTLVFFNEPYRKEQEQNGGDAVGWVDWNDQYIPQVEAYLNPVINSVEIVQPEAVPGDSILLADTSIKAGETAKIVAVYSSWERAIEVECILAYRIHHDNNTYMISVNTPFYPFSDPDFEINEDEFPVLLIPLSEIGIDYASFDARVEYFGGSYYGDERQLYCDAVKELQLRCGLEETGDYDLLTRMWLNHLEVNAGE